MSAGATKAPMIYREVSDRCCLHANYRVSAEWIGRRLWCYALNRIAYTAPPQSLRLFPCRGPKADAVREQKENHEQGNRKP
jgi:hypothetical protein